MKIEAVKNTSAVAERAADLLAAALVEAVAERGTASVAFSGGSTPGPTLERLARRDVPWDRVHIAQVDERIAPDGDADRNLTMLRRTLLDHIKPAAVLAMPVDRAVTAPVDAAAAYEIDLASVAGQPIRLDVVQLGLGGDGHTASLVPNDPVLDVTDRDVSITDPYQGRRRMTLTAPVLRRARRTIWVITGESKREALGQLVSGDSSIPASLLTRGEADDDGTTIVTDLRHPAVTPCVTADQ